MARFAYFSPQSQQRVSRFPPVHLQRLCSSASGKLFGKLTQGLFVRAAKRKKKKQRPRSLSVPGCILCWRRPKDELEQVSQTVRWMCSPCRQKTVFSSCSLKTGQTLHWSPRQQQHDFFVVVVVLYYLTSPIRFLRLLLQTSVTFVQLSFWIRRMCIVLKDGDVAPQRTSHALIEAFRRQWGVNWRKGCEWKNVHRRHYTLANDEADLLMGTMMVTVAQA